MRAINGADKRLLTGKKRHSIDSLWLHRRLCILRFGTNGSTGKIRREPVETVKEQNQQLSAIYLLTNTEAQILGLHPSGKSSLCTTFTKACSGVACLSSFGGGSF